VRAGRRKAARTLFPSGGYRILTTRATMAEEGEQEKSKE
jgi:hypothetical protein